MGRCRRSSAHGEAVERMSDLVECPRCATLNIWGCFLCLDINLPADGFVPAAMAVEYSLLGIGGIYLGGALPPIRDLRKRHGFNAE